MRVANVSHEPGIKLFLLSLILLLLWDFTHRIYSPAVAVEQAALTVDKDKWQQQLSVPKPEGLLASFFKPESTTPAASSKQPEATALSPLQGSELLGDSHYRLRAVFSRQQGAQLLQQALLEQQIASGPDRGKVAPLLLKLNEHIAGYTLSAILASSIVLTNDAEQRTLALFTPSEAQAQSLPLSNENAVPNTLDALLQQADSDDAEELKALLELMKNQ